MEWDALSPDDWIRWQEIMAAHSSDSDHSIGSSLPDISFESTHNISVDSDQFNLELSSNHSNDIENSEAVENLIGDDNNRVDINDSNNGADNNVENNDGEPPDDDNDEQIQV